MAWAADNSGDREDGPVRVVFAHGGPALPPNGHEQATLHALARRLAALNDWPWGGDDTPCQPGPACYLVPQATLETTEAAALGIDGPDDLFGGVVPHAFVATKLVSHPALGRHAGTPEGWSHELAAALKGTVLPGHAIFAPGDARRAYRLLRPLGPVRLKLARGIGGGGQWVLHDEAALDHVLSRLPPGELEHHGASVEQHLEAAVTYSVGSVHCGRFRIAYTGTQCTTRNHQGDEAYGGSTLTVVRGGFDALAALRFPLPVLRALEQVRRYDSAMDAAFPGFFASRRNYDVISGRGADGMVHSGVLEQSWRLGGASPAEILAMEAFAADPSLQSVRVACHESYGGHVPADAVVHYAGTDPRLGALVKYARVEANGYPA